MCGIAGLVPFPNSRLKSISPIRVLEEMTERLAHRGPDNKGKWHDADRNIYFGHRRLSIIDLSANASQPMHSESGRYTICFNGEIYNYKSLRNELSMPQDANTPLNSDTAVLLRGIENWGIKETLQKCNGMFAFALWDNKKKELSLARDRLGQKPLYYGFSKNFFLFSSELKAISCTPGFEKNISKKALFNYFRRGYVPHPMSIFEGVCKLSPGSMVVLPLEDIHKKTPPNQIEFWDLSRVVSEGIRTRSTSLRSDSSQIRDLLTLSVQEAMVADTPVGAFLSGGIDSTLITAIMKKVSSNRVNTFTIGFWDQEYDEAHYAKRVAEHLGTNHHEYYVQPEDALAVIPKLSLMFDEPFADSSQIPTFLVSKIAASELKVALSGDGGDEVFGGYNRYTWNRRIAIIMNFVPAYLRSRLFDLLIRISPQQWDNIFKTLHLAPSQRLIGDKIHKLYHTLSAANADQSYDFLTSVFANHESFFQFKIQEQESLSDVLKATSSLAVEDRMMMLDSLTYLPNDILTKVDRSSMFNSLEVRAPFLDHRLVEAAWRMPLEDKICSGQGKLPLREILNEFVPPHLIERPKSGFAIPIGSWLRNDLKDWCEDLLAPIFAGNDANLNAHFIQQTWAEHLSGYRNWQHKLWAILMYQGWKKEYCE